MIRKETPTTRNARILRSRVHELWQRLQGTQDGKGVPIIQGACRGGRSGSQDCRGPKSHTRGRRPSLVGPGPSRASMSLSRTLQMGPVSAAETYLTRKT